MSKRMDGADDGEEGRITVLIVDDHEMFAESLSRVLGTDESLTVTGVASTVERGVALAATLKPTIAVVDYTLPDGDGSDATRRILEASPETKVLILTGRTDDRALLAAIEAGSSGFVTKDNAVAELLKAIRLVNDGEAYITPRMLAALLPKFGKRQRTLGSDLTPREVEVLSLVAEGLTNDAIAKRMVLEHQHRSEPHSERACRSSTPHSKLEAMVIARREGLIDE